MRCALHRWASWFVGPQAIVHPFVLLPHTGSTYTVGLWARGAWVGAPLTTPDGPSWGPGVAPLVQLSHTTGATTGGWVCSAKTLVSTPWASAASVTASDSALDGFAEGDLYYGVVAQVCVLYGRCM